MFVLGRNLHFSRLLGGYLKQGDNLIVNKSRVATGDGHVIFTSSFHK